MQLMRSADEGLEQDTQRGVGADLQLGLALVAEDLLARQILGFPHAPAEVGVAKVEQVFTERAGQQFRLALHESLGDIIDGTLHCRASQRRHLAPLGGAAGDHLLIFARLATADAGENLEHFLELQDAHLEAIFQVQQRIADVIGGLDQPRQRVTAPAAIGPRQQTTALGDLIQQHALALIAAELAARRGVLHRPRVLEQRAQRRCRQAHAAMELVVFDLGNDAKALGIAFVGEQVLALGIAQPGQPTVITGGLGGEPVTNGVLPGMPEGRVADVMPQAAGLDDDAEIRRRDPVGQLLLELLADHHAQRAADAADLQRVSQPRVDMVVVGQRVDLGLAPQATEGAREHDAVVVLVEGSPPHLTRYGARCVMQATRFQQSLPAHR